MNFLKITIAAVFLMLIASASYPQHIKVENGEFKVVNYTLIEAELIYRVYDYYTKECIHGGGMESSGFYEWNYLSNKKGKYRIVIYLKPGRIFIDEVVEVK